MAETNTRATTGLLLDQIRAEQVRELYRVAPFGVFSALFAALALDAILVGLGDLSPHLAAGWATYPVSVVLLHMWLCVAYAKRRASDTAWRRWARWFVVCAIAEGLAWGVASLWPLATAGLVSQLVTILVGTTIAATSPVGYGSYLPACYAFFFTAMLPLAVGLMPHRDWLHETLCLLAIADLIVVSALARRSNQAFTNALTLRFENAALARDLQVQKDSAERASAEKSRFLAAASHDLRQPVHALSLFIGALRERNLDAGARRIVADLDETVLALEELFGDLLDISRLDAGVVEPRCVAVAIQPLLARIIQAHTAEAKAKGLSLRLVPCSAIVHTDPTLLDRIVRNLVSNAVRYTDRGGVLVGCRRGPRLRVCVIDTGRGIASSDHELIFQEFAQIGNPERDRSKGIGLGLAIVRRLCALLDHPLTLRSQPGRGSMFAISVPLANDQQRIDWPRATPFSTGDAAGEILVIDDEPSIREGMRALLTSWNYSVRTAGSFKQALLLVYQGDTAPNLIICDFRLPGEISGIDTIRQLRGHLRRPIPALLVSGDTGPERLREAAASGLLMLHKPVPRGRLRAAVSHLIRQPA